VRPFHQFFCEGEDRFHVHLLQVCLAQLALRRFNLRPRPCCLLIASLLVEAAQQQEVNDAILSILQVR
jgi:hypothetical protein